MFEGYGAAGLFQIVVGVRCHGAVAGGVAAAAVVAVALAVAAVDAVALAVAFAVGWCRGDWWR